MNMRAFILALAILATAPLAKGQTTRPTPVQNEMTVLLLPLKPISEASSQTWISQAIEQSFVNDLSRGRSLARPIVSAAGGPASTPEEALKAAKGTNATLVLFGSYQVNDSGLRIMAQVLDAKTGKPLGSLKATGALRDLFALEDELAGQLKRLLAAAAPARIAPQPPAPPQGADEPQANPFILQPQGPIAQIPAWVRNPDILTPPQPDYGYWANRYNYGYPAYYWGWPGCYVYPIWTWGGFGCSSYVPAYVPGPSIRITRW